MKVHEVTKPPFRAVTAVGSRAELEVYVQSAARSGELVQAADPRPMANGLWLRRAILWEAAQPLATVHALPSGRAPARRPTFGGWSLTPRQRRRVAVGAAVAAAAAGLVVAVVLLLRAAWVGASGWATSNPALAILIGFVVVVAGLLRLTRSRGGRSSNACPGLIHHCAKCPDH